MADASEDQVIALPDAGGDTLSVRRFEGRLWPNFPVTSIAGVKTLKLRDDDVFVLSYPKSGTHWIWEMIRLLLAGRTDLPVVEKESGMIELSGPEKVEALPSPRILNTHAHFEQAPTELLRTNHKCKLVYVTRDPRDVAVSYFHHHSRIPHYHYSGQWKNYLAMYLDGKVDYESWFTYTKGWEEGIKNHPELQVHVTSYEALHEDTVLEAENLAKFLGVSADKTFLEDVIKKTSFDFMRTTKEALHGKAQMYRKGKTGDWKNWFTVTQSEQFDDVFEKEMAGTKAYELYSHKK